MEQKEYTLSAVERTIIQERIDDRGKDDNTGDVLIGAMNDLVYYAIGRVKSLLMTDNGEPIAWGEIRDDDFEGRAFEVADWLLPMSRPTYKQAVQKYIEWAMSDDE